MTDDPTLPLVMPTVPGKARGIISTDPLVLQCEECGTTTTQPPGRAEGAFIILAGFRFHACEPGAPRRCPACLATVLAACSRRDH